MYAMVGAVRRLGVDMTQKEIRVQKTHLRFLCIHDKPLGRTSNFAVIHPGMPMDTQPLPPLHGAQLAGMSTMD